MLCGYKLLNLLTAMWSQIIRDTEAEIFIYFFKAELCLQRLVTMHALFDCLGWIIKVKTVRHSKMLVVFQ